MTSLSVPAGGGDPARARLSGTVTCPSGQRHPVLGDFCLIHAAAPTALTASNFRLQASSYNPVVNGTFYVSASAGSSSYGSLWTFTRSSGPTQHASAFPIGNEDLSYWAANDQLWTLTEYAGNRSVVAVTPADF